MKPRDYDSTVARIAGNLLSGRTDWVHKNDGLKEDIAGEAVAMARAIVVETRRTETPERSIADAMTSHPVLCIECGADLNAYMSDKPFTLGANGQWFCAKHAERIA